MKAKFFATLLLTFTLPFSVHASEKLKVVASFSILGDMVKNVASDDVELKILVGANGDAHEYQPTPADAKAISKADLVIVNGLGFEGWLPRLVKSSGYKGTVLEASKGISSLFLSEKTEKGEPHHHEHDGKDPHAWQNLANGKIYVKNIRDALIAADKAHADDYRKNAKEYLKKLDDAEIFVKSELAKIPTQKRKLVTTHDAFAYFAKAYNVEFLAAQGISTEGQPTAADVAKLIDQIRTQKVTTIFLENMTDSRLIKQLEKDAGAKLGGTLYSDALSAENEPAPNYIAMFKHNVSALVSALMGK